MDKCINVKRFVTTISIYFYVSTQEFASPYDIELTSYVLLLRARQKNLNLSLPIARWLIGQMSGIGGFVSIQGHKNIYSDILVSPPVRVSPGAVRTPLMTPLIICMLSSNIIYISQTRLKDTVLALEALTKFAPLVAFKDDSEGIKIKILGEHGESTNWLPSTKTTYLSCKLLKFVE
ncbi:hypothetical protein HELRODRAFT_172892 [Helobdella robusta]|uniref:Alpha-macroglobulin-like TED domain-containing protein n=1 Tax=Helobdella robusta TaxID=6412 RepID=T1F631_HELRO|nr:hypothetical protein HELRODRAFT_172892 [Helobdella robusta]ESO03868.1 hypothetical protein HELRODRAFT_172892 [Helobdella robusta]